MNRNLCCVCLLGGFQLQNTASLQNRLSLRRLFEVSSVTEVLPLHKFLQAQDPQEQREPSSSFAQE